MLCNRTYAGKRGVTRIHENIEIKNCIFRRGSILIVHFLDFLKYLNIPGPTGLCPFQLYPACKGMDEFEELSYVVDKAYAFSLTGLDLCPG